MRIYKIFIMPTLKCWAAHPERLWLKDLTINQAMSRFPDTCKIVTAKNEKQHAIVSGSKKFVIVEELVEEPKL